MKRLSIFMAATALFLLSTNAVAQNPAMKQTANKAKSKGNINESMTLPYKAQFTKFAIGDAKYSRMVLNAWKAWDDNRLDDLDHLWADTITAILPDGRTIKGKEAFINEGKNYRSGFTAVTSEVVAYTSLKSLHEGGGPVVLIWGDESGTKPDGTTQKIALHEVWGFNKAGKVAFLRQYAGQVPQQGN